MHAGLFSGCSMLAGHRRTSPYVFCSAHPTPLSASAPPMLPRLHTTFRMSHRRNLPVLPRVYAHPAPPKCSRAHRYAARPVTASRMFYCLPTRITHSFPQKICWHIRRLLPQVDSRPTSPVPTTTTIDRQWVLASEGPFSRHSQIDTFM